MENNLLRNFYSAPFNKQNSFSKTVWNIIEKNTEYTLLSKKPDQKIKTTHQFARKDGIKITLKLSD